MAVSILGLSVVVILGNVRHSLRMDRIGRQSMIASLAAQQKLEEILSGLDDGQKSEVDLSPTDRDGTFDAWPWLKYHVSIAEAEPTVFEEVEIADLLSVEVTVSWTDSVERKLTLSHLAVKDGEFP